MGGIEGGFISVWRKMREWEWFDDDAVFKIFIGLLWLANYKEQKWKGITIKRGSFVTSVPSLCVYLGKSKNSVLRALKLLKSTGEITEEVVPNKYRIITVVNYDKYQMVQDLNQCEDNCKTNSRTNSKTKRKVNKRDDGRDTTNKEISGGVCPTDTHTPPQERENAASPSVPQECGTNEPPKKETPPLTEGELRRYCESKGKDAYYAAQLWLDHNGVFSEANKKKVRDWLEEHVYHKGA